MLTNLTLGIGSIILAVIIVFAFFSFLEMNERTKAEKTNSGMLNTQPYEQMFPNTPPPPKPKFQTGDKVYYIEPTMFTPLGLSDIQGKVIPGVIISEAGAEYFIVATEGGLSRISCYGLQERDWLTDTEECAERTPNLEL